jgi:hypothetical protein
MREVAGYLVTRIAGRDEVQEGGIFSGVVRCLGLLARRASLVIQSPVKLRLQS